MFTQNVLSIPSSYKVVFVTGFMLSRNRPYTFLIMNKYGTLLYAYNAFFAVL